MSLNSMVPKIPSVWYFVWKCSPLGSLSEERQILKCFTGINHFLLVGLVGFFLYSFGGKLFLVGSFDQLFQPVSNQMEMIEKGLATVYYVGKVSYGETSTVSTQLVVIEMVEHKRLGYSGRIYSEIYSGMEIKVFRNENSSQTNANSHYSNYS